MVLVSAPRVSRHEGTSPEFQQQVLKPDFLVISTARTGTNWLRTNLNAHGRVTAIGETLWFYDLCIPYHAFARYFGPGRVNGDVTPMYALLGEREVARVHDMLPACKLVVIIRDPVTRAWSHIKHMAHHGEALFSRGETDYFKAAACYYALILGDYLGTLERWLSSYSRSSLLLAFYEDIRRRPCELLEEVFEHIGAGRGRQSSQANRVFNQDPSGRGECPPVLKMYLQQIYRKRTQTLVDRFRLTPPPEWESTLQARPLYDLDYWAYNHMDIEEVKMQILRKWMPRHPH